MFSNGTSPPLLTSNRRLERPSRPTRDMNLIRPPRRVESVLVNNVNIAFASLNPNHPKLRVNPSLPSPTPSARSFQSAYSSYTTSSMSSSSSLGPYNVSQPELSIRHRLYDDFHTTQKARTMPGDKRTPTPRATIPLARTSSREAPTIHVPDARSYTPRPSFDSVTSSDSDHSWLDLNLKPRKPPPPPLQLNDSNLRPKIHHNKPPVIEVIAPGPPRGASRLSSYSINPTTPPPQTPGSPDIKLAYEEETRRRQLPPPPLHLSDSNLRPKKRRNTPVIEVIAPGPPRGASRLSSYSTNPTSPPPQTPGSPDIKPPSEEEIRRRRHEKVMQITGERVPPELVYRGRKILNVTVFPEPLSSQIAPPQHEEASPKLTRRSSSFTLLSFPSISSSLRATTNHGRNKSRDLLEFADSPNTSTPTPIATTPVPPSSTPTPLTFPRLNHHRRDTRRRSVLPNRPETVYSPMIFADSVLEKTPTQSFRFLADSAAPEGEGGGGYHPFSVMSSPEEIEAERAAKLARRASLSTATFLPSSPMRDGFRDLSPETPVFVDRTRARRSERLSSISTDSGGGGGGLIDVVNVTGRSRPESMMASPLVFARHVSLVPPPPDGIKLLVEASSVPPADDDDDGDDEESDYGSEDSGMAGSRTPPYYERQIQSDQGHLSHYHSHPPLPPPPPPHPLRSDAPFQNSGIPLESYLAPPSSWSRRGNGGGGDDGKDLVQRKERRQGWSGEWNQGDMQDVIKKLRSLK